MCSPSTESSRREIVALDPATFRRHRLHAEERIWAETNCYTDVMIELLHGLGYEPLAMLPFTLAIDFEGDQWTFFKPPNVDLLELYGLDIQELSVWRPLAEHIDEQIARGRPVLVELDSYFLPDTAGTAYRRAHQKSGVAVNAIDIDRRELGYFHNQGYYILHEADFCDLFQLGGLVHERILPPYIEFAKWKPDFIAPRSEELTRASLGLLAKHLARVPRANPFARFKARFARDLDWLLQSEIERFHAYSFVTLRQYGACFELSERYLRWLGEQGVGGFEAPASAFHDLSAKAKAFQFQLARAVARKKPLDLSPLDAMGTQWESGMAKLRARAH